MLALGVCSGQCTAPFEIHMSEVLLAHTRTLSKTRGCRWVETCIVFCGHAAHGGLCITRVVRKMSGAVVYAPCIGHVWVERAPFEIHMGEVSC